MGHNNKHVPIFVVSTGERWLWLPQFEKLHQDPLEHFFGCIRAHGIKNVNPTPNSFIGSFKTSLLNNYSSVNSQSADCEVDSYGSLSSFKNISPRRLKTYAEGQYWGLATGDIIISHFFIVHSKHEVCCWFEKSLKILNVSTVKNLWHKG